MQFIAVVLLVTLHAWILANKIILKLLYSQNSFSELSDACKYYTVSTFNLPFNWYFYLHPQVDKGIRDVLQSDELFDCKPAIHRAFHFAKNKSQGESEHGPDYIEFREFRLFLQTLRQYFEYYQAFDRLDSHRIIVKMTYPICFRKKIPFVVSLAASVQFMHFFSPLDLEITIHTPKEM